MPNTTEKLGSSPAEGLLPIRTVSALTGVNAVTLRAWERRYSLIMPQRTPKGHRLYTQQDVQRINRIVELLNQGISVGHVKPTLEQLPGTEMDVPGAEGEGNWKCYQDKMISAIEQFDESALDGTYNDALSLYPIDIVNQRLTTPLLRVLGERWKQRQAAVAEEHFFSVYLRNKLGARIHHINQRNTGPLLLLACLPREFHEIGLLFFALAGANFGYRVLVLGAGMNSTEAKHRHIILPDQNQFLHQALAVIPRHSGPDELPIALIKRFDNIMQVLVHAFALQSFITDPFCSW